MYWPKGQNGLAQIVTYFEWWLARIAIYHEQGPMFNILYNRLHFCCTVMCEHNLRKIRNGDNMKLFKPTNKEQKPMHTITNVLNLANIHTGKYIRQHVSAGNRTIQNEDLDDEDTGGSQKGMYRMVSWGV